MRVKEAGVHSNGQAARWCEVDQSKLKLVRGLQGQSILLWWQRTGVNMGT